MRAARDARKPTSHSCDCDGGWRVSRPGGRTSACAALITVLAFAFFYLRLELTRVEILENNCVFGADVARYAEGLNQRAYLSFNLRKHPLAVGAVTASAGPLSALGVPPGPAGSIALAAWQALGSLAIFVFLRRHFLKNLHASLLTILILSSFSAVTVFSVPETYGITFAAASLGLVVLGEIARLAARRPLSAGLFAGVAAAPAGWANLPAAAIVLAYAGLAWHHHPRGGASRLASAVILPCGVCLAATALPTLILDTAKDFAWQQHYVASYASWSNFTDVRTILDYLASFLVFPIAAPLDHVRCRFTVSDLAEMGRSTLRVAAWAAGATLVVLGIAWALVKPTSRPFAVAMLAIAASLFVFYLYFNPDEALLYSSGWVVVLYVAAAAGLRETRLTAATLAVAVALAWSVNIAPLHDRRTADRALCCPVPPAPERHLYPPTGTVSASRSQSRALADAYERLGGKPVLLGCAADLRPSSGDSPFGGMDSMTAAHYR